MIWFWFVMKFRSIDRDDASAFGEFAAWHKGTDAAFDVTQ
jgi:hypothetical protein